MIENDKNTYACKNDSYFLIVFNFYVLNLSSFNINLLTSFVNKLF